ncbi:hypothetical protein [Glycomyces sp. NPDC048151]|uniref:hypothetical protein n=1 Tax=Glycomyces sp. NPDC048151 TaxID=3364002 RepID=UPI0037144C95
MEDDIETEHRSGLGRLVAVGVTGLAMTAVFGVGLCANGSALADGYRASGGSLGTPGEAVVTSVEEERDGQVCKGRFAPEDGGALVEARIEVRGDCVEGQQVEANLAPAHTSLFVGDEHPRAWAPGAQDWGLFVPFVVLFAVVCAMAAALASVSLARAAVIVWGRSRFGR